MLGPLQLNLDLVNSLPPSPPPLPSPLPPVVVNVGFPQSFGNLKQQLALRLGDANNIFWTDPELGLYIQESLRFFALCSGFWKNRGTFQTSLQASPYYDIYQNLNSGVSPFFILKPTVTDWQIIQYIQFHLLENTTIQSSWIGTEQFTFLAVQAAVQNRLNQFLGDTGCIVNRTFIAASTGRIQLDLATIDVRHAAWWRAADGYYTPLWRTDERELTASGSPTWSTSFDTPDSYSVMAPPPLVLQLSPPPDPAGALELLVVNGVTLNTAAQANVMGIPDHMAAAVKWGALADLLGQDGIARDPVRATYCEQMYGLYVKLARVMPVVLHAEINGVPLIPSTLQEADAFDHNWENNSLFAPKDLILASNNLVALSPVPNGVYSVTCDVVTPPPIPVQSTDKIQLTFELLDMILDYSEHLALFKVYGMEWHATDRAAQNFMNEALTFNQRISAAVRNSLTSSDQSQRQKQQVPRRINSPVGLGGLRNG